MATRHRRIALRRRRNSWFDDAAGHRKASLLGWRRRKRSGKKKNPSARRRGRRFLFNPRPMSYLPNPFLGGQRLRRFRRRIRRNPFAVRGLVPTRQTIRQAVKVGTGVAAGFASTPILSAVLEMMVKDTTQRAQFDRFLGLGQILLGSLMVGMGRRKDIKDVGIMVAGFGVYDLVARNLGERSPGEPWLPALPRLTGITSAIMPAPAAVSASYGVARAPVSAVARAGMAASYRSPQVVGASFEAPSISTVGVAGDLIEAVGHLPGVDFD